MHSTFSCISRRFLVPAIAAAALVGCESSVVTEVAPEANTSMAIGPNGGFIYRLVNAGGEGIGNAEIKLHDDKGDLEVWLNKGSLATTLQGGSVWDLSLDSQLTLDFPELEKEVTLAVRDSETNEDEAGKSMIREGMTNYFIFPGDSGADASWLQGHHFEQTAVLTFEVDGVKATTQDVRLVPHGHSDSDHSHDHPHPH